MDFINLPILLFSILLCVSILTSLLSGRIGIPLILIFLCIGVITGAGRLEMLQSLQHPRILFFVGSVALAMILFWGDKITQYFFKIMQFCQFFRDF